MTPEIKFWILVTCYSIQAVCLVVVLWETYQIGKIVRRL